MEYGEGWDVRLRQQTKYIDNRQNGFRIMKNAIKRDALDVLIRPFQKSSWIVAMIIFVLLAICGHGMPLLEPNVNVYPNYLFTIDIYIYI